MSTYELYRLAPWLMGLAVAMGYALALRRPHPPAWMQALKSPLGPLGAALVTAATILFVAGGRAPTPVISDEASYRLQAELLAQGKWSAPSPPLPHFFEQMHVQVVPTLTSKYFPGHALAIAPGVAVGSPWLMLLLMNAAAGALVFLLARRHFGIGVAVLAVALLIASGANMRWRASWYSEITSSLLMLGAWWTAGHLKHHWSIATTIVLVAALALTRPLTAVAAAIPLAAVVLFRAVREGRLRELAVGIGAGTLLIGVLPIWAHSTTGSWHETPQSRYTRDYMPWDRLGFGLDTTPPRREVPPDQQAVGLTFLGIHAAHSPDTMVPTVAGRVAMFIRHVVSDWRTPLAGLALLGMVAGGWVVVVPLATAVLQFGLYGLYAHPAGWTLYYLELFPILAVLIAGGIGLVLAQLIGKVRPDADVTGSLLVVAAGVAIGAIPDLRIEKGRLHHFGAPTRAFRSMIDSLPSESIVFVRYGPDHFAHRALITNLAPLENQRAIVVYDRGEENQELWLHFSDRTPYVYMEETRTLHRITPADTAAGSARAPAGP